MGCILAHEVFHFLAGLRVFKNVAFVDHDDDFLTPGEDLFEEETLALSQRAFGRSDKQHQVGTGYIFVGEAFVPTVDGVSTRRVNDIQLF